MKKKYVFGFIAVAFFALTLSISVFAENGIFEKSLKDHLRIPIANAEIWQGYEYMENRICESFTGNDGNTYYIWEIVCWPGFEDCEEDPCP